MTVLLGFGRNAFALRRHGARRARAGSPTSTSSAPPTPDGGGPLLRGSGLRYAPDVRANMATEAFCVQVIADTKLAVDRAVVETWKALADPAEPALELTTFYLGNQRDDRRSWIDFHDGLSNLRSEDRESVIAIGPGTDEPGPSAAPTSRSCAWRSTSPAGGAWRAPTRSSPSAATSSAAARSSRLGEDGAPRTDPGCPVTGTQICETPNDAPFAEPPEVSDPVVRASHVQRANHHIRPASDSGSRRIFRQGYEFLEWAGERAGLSRRA